MKKLILLSFFMLIIIHVSAQDTIIEHQDFTLEIRKVKESSQPYQSIKTDTNLHVVDFYWRNNSISYIVSKWMEFIQMEAIEYRLDGDFSKRREYVRLNDSTVMFTDGYDVRLTHKNKGKSGTKEMHLTAFEVFASVVGLELEIVSEEITFWTLTIVDYDNASISIDQNLHWRRTETEEYVYYERIDYRRIADLLGRKLDDFVRPIPYQYSKFDIRMPYSDDVFDLKYAMIEHGLELVQVTEMIDVLVINLTIE